MESGEIKNAEDLKSLLLIYLAEADYNITDVEKELILKHVNQAKYEAIKNSMNRLSDMECLERITQFANEFLPDLASRTDLIDEMERLYLADTKRSVLERNMILGLKKILLY